MPMPNRNVEGDYRYAFQGQEKDPETGKEAFELRLWDSRIGRWLTTDPYGQHASPYMGMGNNPISRIDPDGGMDCPDPPCNGGFDGGSLDTVDLGTIKPKVNISENLLGWGDVWNRFNDWLFGTGPERTFEIDNDFANAFKDAKGIESARTYFYGQLNNGRDLFDNPVTNYDTKFGLDGLIEAGADPYEQFVGTYKVTEIKLVRSGDVYEINYTLVNQTHFRSAAYQIPGVPSWDRSTYGPGGNVTQHIEFREPLNYSRLNSGVPRYIDHQLGGLIRN